MEDGVQAGSRGKGEIGEVGERRLKRRGSLWIISFYLVP